MEWEIRLMKVKSSRLTTCFCFVVHCSAAFGKLLSKVLSVGGAGWGKVEGGEEGRRGGGRGGYNGVRVRWHGGGEEKGGWSMVTIGWKYTHTHINHHQHLWELCLQAIHVDTQVILLLVFTIVVCATFSFPADINQREGGEIQEKVVENLPSKKREITAL